MGLFGFVGELTGAAVKIVASPIVIAADVVSVATGNEADNTSKLVESIGDNLEKSVDKLIDE